MSEGRQVLASGQGHLFTLYLISLFQKLLVIINSLLKLALQDLCRGHGSEDFGKVSFVDGCELRRVNIRRDKFDKYHSKRGIEFLVQFRTDCHIIL